VFPRVVGGSPVLFPATRRYAEDYGLWCRLSRSGRVECPVETIYRYRQHDRSISSQQKAEQSECALQIRREYQSQYLRSARSSELTGELSRFWTLGGDRPLSEDIQDVDAMLTELRSGFSDLRRAALWTSGVRDAGGRSLRGHRRANRLLASPVVRFLDRRAAVDLLSLATSRRNAVGVVGDAIRATARAGLARIRRCVRNG